MFCFFFNDTATTEIYTYGHTLSLHDALPIFRTPSGSIRLRRSPRPAPSGSGGGPSSTTRSTVLSSRSIRSTSRSEEHTSELQSLMRISYAVFCLKKNKINQTQNLTHQLHTYTNTHATPPTKITDIPRK